MAYYFKIKETFITIYRWTTALSITFITGSIALIFVVISFGKLRNLCVTFIIKPSSRSILWVNGFRGYYPPLDKFPKHQVLYTFNHNAEQDLFLLTALGLQNTKFLLSEKTWIYIPLVISALATGTFYIPQKKHARRRLKFFKKTTKFLQKTNYSIAASSEGVHEHFHGIAPFNRGIYRMALEANLPIVPLFINVPKESDNRTFGIELLDEISTKDWQVYNLDKHIEHVRTIFVNRFNELNPNCKTT
ncbi:lysophospholipid acyltransferase family protein [Aestuariivivens insulae]|uniref:lysophospholipid acyltransferase family protein n=1 Tax=Aestuariivivens insulae TaxID=1621988 RepID=UPI001F58FA17|nr:1-acyl-sn-glycerol-3-phosphate acyltransferase [Aestuariivivens insulae]